MASVAYAKPTPELPAKVLAPTADACLTISNCECSESATIIFSLEFPVGNHLCQVVHDASVWSNGICRNHIYVRNLDSLGDLSLVPVQAFFLPPC